MMLGESELDQTQECDHLATSGAMFRCYDW